MNDDDFDFDELKLSKRMKWILLFILGCVASFVISMCWSVL